MQTCDRFSPEQPPRPLFCLSPCAFSMGETPPARQSVSIQKAHTANAETLKRRPINVLRTLPKRSTQLSDRAGMLPKRTLGKITAKAVTCIWANERQENRSQTGCWRGNIGGNGMLCVRQKPGLAPGFACGSGRTESVQRVVQNFVDDTCRNGDQDQVSTSLLPLITVIVRQPA